VKPAIIADASEMQPSAGSQMKGTKRYQGRNRDIILTSLTYWAANRDLV